MKRGVKRGVKRGACSTERWSSWQHDRPGFEPLCGLRRWRAPSRPRRSPPRLPAPAPAPDPDYKADVHGGEGKKAKGVFYEGDLSLSRHRTVGLVNELIDSHIHKGAADPTQTQAGAGMRPLTVDEQQAKLED